MKHIKLFENFMINEGYTLPEDILDFEPMDVSDSGEGTPEQVKMANQIYDLEEDMGNMASKKVKVVGTEPYNKCLEILKKLGYKDTTKWEERWNAYDQDNGH
jgi:hypothetical protein